VEAAPQTTGPRKPWYKSCGAQALGNFALHRALDALGLIPSEGAVAAAFYGGKAAFQATQFGLGLTSPLPLWGMILLALVWELQELHYPNN